MQFSESWLRQFVNPAIDSKALGHAMTMAGLEVEEQRSVAPPFSKVVVAEIISAEQHPDADRLRVCRVNAGPGFENLQIVCGAPNANYFSRAASRCRSLTSMSGERRPWF